MTPQRTIRSTTHFDHSGRAYRVAILTCFAALALAGCAAQVGDTGLTTGSVNPAVDPQSAVRREEKVVRIALVLPFGAIGPNAAVAKAMKQAGEMALFDRDDVQFQIMPIDDRGTPEGARIAVEQAVRDGAELVLGPLFSPSVASAAPVARERRVPMIAFSNDQQVAGNGVYLMSYLPDQEVRRVISFAAAEGRRRIAALLPDDAFGRTAETALRSAAQEGGASIALIERYPPHANGMIEPARRLADQMREAEAGGQPIDALFLPGGYETLSNVGPLLTYAGIDPTRVRILGTGGLDHPAIGKDPMFRGAWYAGADPRGWQEFSARFSKTFGTMPPRVAALVYDAVTAAATLAREPAATRYSPGNLTRPQGFPGVDGTVRLTATGLAARQLAVLEVQDIGAKIIDGPTEIGGAERRISSATERVN